MIDKLTANDRQVGGTHYQAGGNCQHWDWVSINGIGYLEGCASKYVARWRKKGGKQDLLKALHYVEKLMELYERGILPNHPPGLRGWIIRKLGRQLTVHRIPAARFAEANKLEQLEQRAVTILGGWDRLSHLQEVREIIKTLHRGA